jgi:hypothetical protein
MKQLYKLKDFGEAKYVLNINITRHENSISIDQTAYVKKILEQHNMSRENPTHSPVVTGADLGPARREEHIVNIAEFKTAIGELMHLSNHTRPDITHTVSTLASNSNNPTARHWKAIHHLWRYLIGTQNRGITYEKQHHHQSTSTIKIDYVYCDSNWGGNEDESKRRSTSGYVIYMGGGPISWGCKKQDCTAISTMEAEYNALSLATSEVAGMRLLLEDIGFKQNEPTIINIDNKAAIDFTNNTSNHSQGRKARHIDMKMYFARSYVENGTTTLKWIPSEQNIADIFTKSLGGGRTFERLRNRLVKEIMK